MVNQIRNCRLILMMSVFLFLFSCKAVVFQPQMKHMKKLKIETEIMLMMEVHHISGMAVVIVDKHGFIYSEGFGYSNSAKQIQSKTFH